MNFWLLVISLFVGFIFFYSRFVQSNILVKATQLRVIYDRMEMYFVENGLEMSNERIKLLKTFKNVAVNYELLDIRILVKTKIELERKKVDITERAMLFNTSVNAQGKEFVDLYDEFNTISDDIIRQSIYTPSFLVTLAILFILMFLSKGIMSIVSLKDSIRFALSNEYYLSAERVRLTPC